MSKELILELNNANNELSVLRAEFNQFASVVSHDLAAPLRQVEGFASIVQANIGEGFDEKTKHHFDLILKGSQSGSRMIEALLVYSRACSQKLIMTPVDCNDVAKNTLEKLSPMVENLQPTVTIANLPDLKADESQLEKLFYQLFHNALYYHNPDVKPVVTLDVVDEGGYWEFCLTDNGIGVPEKQWEKAFTVLRRAVVKKDPERVGMGLALAKRIVLNHGGSIWIGSSKGHGCKVYFTIPKRLDS